MKEIEPKTIYQALSENEKGDATLYQMLHSEKFLYDHTERVWYYWNDHYWRYDRAMNALKKTAEVTRLYSEQKAREEYEVVLLTNKLKTESDQMERRKISKDIEELHKKIKMLGDRIRQMHTLVRSERILKLASVGVGSLGFVGKWDEKTWLLGCRNGVIDLKTGRKRPGKPDDYIQTVSPVMYQKNAECPRWEQFLFEVFNGDQMIVDFMQRLLGYAITGSQQEAVYPIFWGEKGRNGKTTIMEVLKYILGDMAYKTPTHMIMQGLHNRGDGPNPLLMKFRGTKIVWTSEANEKDQLDAAVIKALSGNDTITARAPYAKEPVEFQPTHTLFTIVNPLPRVSASDDALWRRLVLIPFNLSFVDNPVKDWERQRDPGLMNSLKQEASGILNWLVKGALIWQEQGLRVPEALTSASQEYRQNEDILEYFLSDCCEVDMNNDLLRVGFRPLYNAYKDWGVDAGFKSLNQKHFREQIEKKFGRIKIVNGIREFRGIRLLNMY